MGAQMLQVWKSSFMPGTSLENYFHTNTVAASLENLCLP